MKSKRKKRRSRHTERWRRHTLPHRLQCSTICARGLNCRVRDDAGCTPAALATNTLRDCYAAHRDNQHEGNSTLSHAPKTPNTPHNRTESPRPLVRVSYTHCCAYTPRLSNWWSPSGLTWSTPVGNLVLRLASHLDAFSGYPYRRSLLSYAAGATTDTRALRPPRSSRTRGNPSQIPNAHSG